MGTRGPVGKRESARTRRNKTDDNGVETKKAPAAAKVRVPAEDRAWHSVVKGWWRSLKDSGQSAFFEPSDWQAARMTASFASKVFKKLDNADVDDLKRLRPSVAQVWTMMADLGTTEVARRRVRIELIRAGEGDELDAEVVDIADYQTDYGG
ncbi:hypothetical protein I1A62_29990 [Rhodococcus sp. USK10]|nr:hypothetical protein [Rhodococcus sp. USK10]QYB08016.1 hypothetical protein I1A62_29990 [Rhodococcus sp. USK10]